MTQNHPHTALILPPLLTHSELATMKMMAVTFSKQWIHFLRSDRLAQCRSEAGQVQRSGDFLHVAGPLVGPHRARARETRIDTARTHRPRRHNLAPLVGLRGTWGHAYRNIKLSSY